VAEHAAATAVAALYLGFRVRKGGAALRQRLALEREDSAVCTIVTNARCAAPPPCFTPLPRSPTAAPR